MGHYFRVKKVPEHKKTSFFMRMISRLSIVNFLILVNVLFFILTLLISAIFGNEVMYSYLALNPNNLFHNYSIWTLLTSMFMHAGFFHLFVNMLSLFFIGSFLEMIIGKKRFFWLYIFSGVFAGIFYSLLSFSFGSSIIGRAIFGHPGLFAVGASGAIFAIAGVLAVLTPRNKVYLIAGPIIALIIQAILGLFLQNDSLLNLISILINIYIFISIFAIISFSFSLRKIAVPIRMPFWLVPIVAIIPLIIISLFVELPIANTAHLGGFLFGAVYGIYLRMKYKKKTRAISEYFS